MRDGLLLNWIFYHFNVYLALKKIKKQLKTLNEQLNV